MAVRVLAPVISTEARPFADKVVVDAAGNSYVSGYFSGTVRFGATTFAASSSSPNLYVAKLNAAGLYQWLVQLPAATNALNSLALDASGNVYVAGTFVTATLTLGSTTLRNAGGSDLFVAKLDPTGQWLAATRGGGTGNETVSGLTLDASSNAYVTGQFTGQTAFGTTALVSAGQEDLFTARLDASGTWRWATRAGSAGRDWSGNLGVDAQGYAYTIGQFDAAGGQVGPTVLPAPGFFVARLEAATGAYQRVTPVTGNTAHWAHHIAVTATGECYVAGSYLGSLRFGVYQLTSVGAGISNEDVFVAKLDAAGTWQWASTAGGSSGEYCSGLGVDEGGNVYLGGSFRGPGTRFGATTLVPQNVALFTSDVYVAKLDSRGTWLWAVPAGGGKTIGVPGLR